MGTSVLSTCESLKIITTLKKNSKGNILFYLNIYLFYFYLLGCVRCESQHAGFVAIQWVCGVLVLQNRAQTHIPALHIILTTGPWDQTQGEDFKSYFVYEVISRLFKIKAKQLQVLLRVTTLTSSPLLGQFVPLCRVWQRRASLLGRWIRRLIPLPGSVRTSILTETREVGGRPESQQGFRGGRCLFEPQTGGI